MTLSLWDWQDDEAARLRREGKVDLARLWEQFEHIVGDQGALKAAAERARELDEPRFELLFWHWYVQQGLFRLFANPQSFETAATRLEALAADARCAGIAQHLCARESLYHLKQATDAPGHAEETLRLAESLAGQVPRALDCRGCFELLRIQSLLALGRAEDAAPLVETFSRGDHDDNQRLLALLFAAEIAEQRDQAARMEGHLEQAETLARDGTVNADNAWYVLELRVRCDLLGGDPGRAERRFAAAPPRPPEASMEAIRTELALARGWAEAGDSATSRGHAEAAAGRGLRRGLVRLAAEGTLLAAEACQALGDTEGAAAHAGTLGTLLPQLRSRDLDERARVVGAV